MPGKKYKSGPMRGQRLKTNKAGKGKPKPGKKNKKGGY
jgi:hypothetical protein